MGKKRRVLRNPKFTSLRNHPKYKSLVGTDSKSSGNEQEIEEPEVVVETPVLKTNKEVKTSEAETVKPKLKKAPAKKKASPKTKAKSSASAKEKE